jgi:hypothetical protein
MTEVTSERPATTPVPAARRASGPAQVRLVGEVEHPRSLTVAALRDLPQHMIEAELICAHSGVQRHLHRTAVARPGLGRQAAVRSGDHEGSHAVSAHGDRKGRACGGAVVG